MNQRIRELADQAGLGVRHGGIVLTKNVNAADAFEQFALLIVRECAEVAANVVVEHEGVDFGLMETCYKHFGVEE